MVRQCQLMKPFQKSTGKSEYGIQSKTEKSRKLALFNYALKY